MDEFEASHFDWGCNYYIIYHRQASEVSEDDQDGVITIIHPATRDVSYLHTLPLANDVNELLAGPATISFAHIGSPPCSTHVGPCSIAMGPSVTNQHDLLDTVQVFRPFRVLLFLRMWEINQGFKESRSGTKADTDYRSHLLLM